jgi:murein DD-endopeptidase MepM/ murein hydrolase activator NlpD
MSIAPASALALCKGVRISNAPATDGARQIVGYDNTAFLRGRPIYRAPVAACVSSAFGPRGSGGFHDGVDLFTGKPALAGAGGDGVVVFTGSLRGYGRTVDIDHGDGIFTRYAHLSIIEVSEGQRVNIGQMIGRTGDSGNATAVHLHYEIRIDGRTVNPLTIGGAGTGS